MKTMEAPKPIISTPDVKLALVPLKELKLIQKDKEYQISMGKSSYMEYFGLKIKEASLGTNYCYENFYTLKELQNLSKYFRICVYIDDVIPFIEEIFEQKNANLKLENNNIFLILKINKIGKGEEIVSLQLKKNHLPMKDIYENSLKEIQTFKTKFNEIDELKNEINILKERNELKELKDELKELKKEITTIKEENKKKDLIINELINWKKEIEEKQKIKIFEENKNKLKIKEKEEENEEDKEEKEEEEKLNKKIDEVEIKLENKLNDDDDDENKLNEKFDEVEIKLEDKLNDDDENKLNEKFDEVEIKLEDKLNDDDDEKKLNEKLGEIIENEIRIDSLIIEKKEDLELISNRLKNIEEFKNKNISYNLIYRATKDGGLPNDFHKKCDGIDKTITIIKTIKGAKFGGYISNKWDSNFGWVKDDENCFVFSFNYKKVYNTIKGRKKYILKEDCGPVFAVFGVKDNFFQKNSLNIQTAKVANKNFHEFTMDYEINCGEKEFQVEELEVFHVVGE